MDAEPELHVARSVRLTGNLAECRRTGETQAGIRRLEMIQRVGDRDKYLSARAAFMEAYVLDDGYVQVPGRQAAETAGIAARLAPLTGSPPRGPTTLLRPSMLRPGIQFR